MSKKNRIHRAVNDMFPEEVFSNKIRETIGELIESSFTLIEYEGFHDGYSAGIDDAIMRLKPLTDALKNLKEDEGVEPVKHWYSETDMRRLFDMLTPAFSTVTRGEEYEKRQTESFNKVLEVVRIARQKALKNGTDTK